MSLMGRLKRYRTALGRYRHSKGFGIHSPFAFGFVLNVLRERCPYYAYQTIEEYRSGAKQSARHLPGHPRIISLKNAKMVFRVTNYFNPPQVLQIGTSYGISSASMLSVSGKMGITLYEPNFDNSTIAKEILSDFGERVVVTKDIDRAVDTYKERLEQVPERTAECPGHINLFGGTGAVPFVLINSMGDSEKVCVGQYLDSMATTGGVVIMRNLSRNRNVLELWQDYRKRLSVGMTFSNEKLAIIVVSPKLPRQDFSMWF